MSAGTSGESSLVRYTVCLMARTSGSSTAWATKRSTERRERVVGVVDEDVGAAHRGHHADLLPLLVLLQPRLGDGLVGRIAQLGDTRAA